MAGPVRKISEECSQCELHRVQIKTLVHSQSKALPWKVFVVIMAAYVGLASYNAISIKSLIIDSTAMQTKMENMKDSIARIEKAVWRSTP